MKLSKLLEAWRIKSGDYASSDYSQFGMFKIPYNGNLFRVIASSGLPEEGIHWEHVSVSLSTRCPTWEEMCMVKDLFWAEDECVVQYHPAKKDYKNQHPYCLHLWKPTKQKIPMPPSICV